MAVDKYFVRCTSCDTRFKSQKSVTQEKVARTKCPTCGGQLVVEEEKPDLVLPVAHESVEAKVAVKAARKSYWPLSRGATLALCVIAVAAAATQLVADATIEADATLKAVNSKVSSENEHFYASEAERDRDKHEESGTPSRQSLLAEEKGTRASHPTVIGTQYPDLHYSWAPAQAYAYAFQTKAKVESLFGHTFDGSCQFYAGPSWDQLVAQALPTSHKSEPKDSSQRTEIADELIRDIEGDSETLAQKFSEQPDWDSTGSAFAVTPDGWLVTCAHVVEDAAQIQVEISGKEYAAQVKVIDYKHDLALLKVDAQSLSTLSVAPAETIQLGDEVRAIGFPLADYLKSRINVTRGTISTQPTGEEGDTLQVDAAVNPGNSGGPVINEKGQIVGVASSKIVHEAVSDVSFATPASQVVELAKKYDVGLPEPSQTSLTLRQATEAVGLVRVKLSAKRIRDGVDVRYSTTLSGVAAPSVGIGWYQGKRNRASTCSVDAFGRVQGLPDGLRLPFLWLHPADLVIEQLDTRGRDSWVTDDTYTIDMAAHGPPLGTSHKREVLQPPPGAIHYRTNGFGFPTITQTGGEHNASDPITLSVSAAHKVIERHEEKVVVAKRMEIVATLPEGKPLFEMTGSGGYVFDLTTNNVKETTLKLDCEWQRNKKKTSFPVEFYAKRVSRDVGMVRRSVNSIKKAIREEKAREEKIRADANRVSSTVLSDCVAALTSSKSSSRELSKALDDLWRFPVEDKHQEKLIKALRKIASVKKGYVQARACQLLAKWGGASQSPFLVARLKLSSDDFFADKIVAALGECGDSSVAPTILKYYEESDAAGRDIAVSRALASLGSEVEDLIIPLLKRIDSDTREMACDVLSDIGTEKCLPSLETLIASTRSWDKRRAERAKRAVEDRLANPSKSKSRQIASAKKAKKTPETKPGAKLEGVIASLAAGDSIYKSLQTLSNAIVIDRLQEAAAEAISSHLSVESDGPVTLEAIKAIGVWGNERYSSALVKLLPLVKSDEARESLFVALSQVGDEEASVALQPFIDDEVYGFRAAAAVRRVDPTLKQAFLEQLRDADVYRRAIAAEVLGRAEGADVKKAIESQLEEERIGSLAYERCLVALARIELNDKR